MFSADWHWYFDESGNSANAPLLVIAGFLANADDWALLVERWQAELDSTAEGPRLDYFKMGEAATLQPQGQFARARGWDDEKRNARVRRFSHIICEHVKLRISVSACPQHFTKYISPLPAIGRRLATDIPYPHLFSRLLGEQLVLSHRKGLLHPHDVILDGQTGIEEEIKECWGDYKRAIAKERPQYARLLGSQPYFLDDKQFLPLQAADLYAWHVRAHLESKRKKFGRVLRMLEDVPTKHAHISERDFQDMGARLVKLGAQLQQANPLFQLVPFPSEKRQQKNARRAFAKQRGVKPSRRKLPP